MFIAHVGLHSGLGMQLVAREVLGFLPELISYQPLWLAGHLRSASDHTNSIDNNHDILWPENYDATSVVQGTNNTTRIYGIAKS